MNGNEKFPYVSKELIEAIEKRFTHPVRDLETPVSRLYADIGIQEVVKFLRAHHIRQTLDEQEQLPDVFRK